MEKKTTLRVPDAYSGLIEDIRLLKSDECNPNKMTDKQKEKFGAVCINMAGFIPS